MIAQCDNDVLFLKPDSFNNDVVIGWSVDRAQFERNGLR